MMRRLLVAMGATAVLLGAAAGPAFGADPATEAASHLSSKNPVYNADGADVTIKSDALNGADVPMVVAALPASAGDPHSLATKIGPTVFKSGQGVVVVIAGLEIGSASSFSATVDKEISNVGDSALAKHPLSKRDDATSLVRDFVSGVNTARQNDNAASTNNNSAAEKKGGGGHTGLIVGLIIAAIVIGGAGAFIGVKRRRKRQHLADRRADVVSYYDRLGADVSNLDPGDDAVARQALADAAERYTATGSQLEQAKSDGQFDAARRTALEGLQAARAARIRLGLHPGPELPPIAPTRGDRLTEEKEYTVGDRTVRGHPDYEPGAPYYYGGGGGYGAGWYSFPFWETLLIGSALSGGFGGWGGDGGYDRGYDSGYQAGEDQANDQQQ